MTDEIEAKRRLDTDDRRIWLLQQYYAVLNEQPDFRAALAQLVDDVGEAAHEADSSAAPRSFWDAWNEPRIDDPSEDFIRTGARSMPADVRARLEVFADQWRLPRPNAVVDLWLILLRTRGDGSPGLPDPWPVFKM